MASKRSGNEVTEATEAMLGNAQSGRRPDPIAIALKRMHSEVASEAVPGDFLDILAAIDRKIGSDEPGR